MDPLRQLDIAFDFRSDTPKGKDPDTFSPTLRSYHKFLWSKPLPSGVVFELDDVTPGWYLHHRSKLGEFFLTSDTVVPTYGYSTEVRKMAIPEMAYFDYIRYTIGGMMIFPGDQVDRKMTINGARGFHPLIRDRFDLTLECIRRHYGGRDSPLDKVLARYAGFFALFGDFRGYVEFFLLQDLVEDDCSAVKFHAPFEDFGLSPIPQTLEMYQAYQERSEAFIKARNRRVAQYCRS